MVIFFFPQGEIDAILLGGCEPLETFLSSPIQYFYVVSSQKQSPNLGGASKTFLYEA